MWTPTIYRRPLPRPTDRLPLGASGLAVSPYCIGITKDPATIVEAFDAGINFFFLTADLHWPLYEGLRRGLEMLFERGGGIRDQVVVGVVSYLDQPMFEFLQFHEVLGSVQGFERVDLLIAGATPDEQSLQSRYGVIHQARSRGHCGARAIGASFHHRRSALISLNLNYLDVNFIRYNPSHPGALEDIFPYLRPDRTGLIFNFKSLMSVLSRESFESLGLSADRHWLPRPTDYYRFVLSNPNFNGILCSPDSPQHLETMLEALAEGSLTPQEEQTMMWLAKAVPRYF